MAYADGGKCTFVYKGTYSNTKTYERLDYVMYNQVLYVAIKNTLGHTPVGDDSDSYWKRLIDTKISITDSEWTSIQALYN